MFRRLARRVNTSSGPGRTVVPGRTVTDLMRQEAHGISHWFFACVRRKAIWMIHTHEAFPEAERADITRADESSDGIDEGDIVVSPHEEDSWWEWSILL